MGCEKKRYTDITSNIYSIYGRSYWDERDAQNAKDEAYIAYMGPFWITFILPAIPLYMITKEPFWALIILLGSMINFFNLIPVSR